MIADLHLHSHCSDGRLDPQALVDCVADAGVELLALTDHDTTAGHAAARDRARARGVGFVGGIEMTTYGEGQVIHVLGIGCDGENGRLKAANAAARAVWDANQRCWIQALEAEQVPISWERDFADHPVRLPVLVERLCRAGVEGGDPVAVHRRFRAFFSALPAQNYRGLASPAQAADIIRNSGGLAFLAHPLALHEAGLAEGLLSNCDGLEAAYSRYSREQRVALRELAGKHRKMFCGGSDYHGYFEPAYRPPEFAIPEALLERLGILLG